MDDVLKELQEAYNILETIPVCGTHAEAMTAVRLHMRSIFAQLSKEEE